MQDTPVVLVHGPRQAGKTTLVQAWAAAHPEAAYATLDDAATFATVEADPQGFLRAFDGPLVLDEVQRAPGLFRAIKLDVDRHRRPGRFLLTGSANVLLLPRLGDSLAGRMEIVPLHPLAAREVEGRAGTFADTLFSGSVSLRPDPAMTPRVAVERARTGGYPEVRARTAARRAAWFGAYVTTILQRDVRDLAAIEGLTELPRLLALVAAQAGGLLNVADLARGLTLSYATAKRYLALMEATFLVAPLHPWSGNVGKRLIKTPKLLLGDAGLLTYLLALPFEGALPVGHPAVGPLVETFVGTELTRQVPWADVRHDLFYFRSADGHEVDYVLEAGDGRLAGIEVKASATVTARDFRGLHVFAETVGQRFAGGAVLYAGTEAVPFGGNLWALPLSALWTG